MLNGQWAFKLPIEIKKKGNLYISSCKILRVYSQGYSTEEAKKNIKEAIKLFLTSCFERGTLDAVLKECGFHIMKTSNKPIKDHRFVTVPIPFSTRGNCLPVCHA